ncbi:uncharacterized protein NDAI_0G05680 [Naumovozyma dairenensis CBS 421]|uniref:Uncharacterized protein n=1 Tax=Naumovozyma dairenensis (strain ATCC 10597 / BCRC 20456 / CBS 421 / NBRC 0211 / NRRL Y-12639) TaxID=1071378 RepID=J7S4N5_NAUDC|nr:hypothetical protein NDAI_0G05680 [Naumovozyma dairenensis CBS 421]CCK73551.1 hypothetical protein NDAI_0G05680 [Naumovozyma dairenensis CBS 421]
MGKIKNTKPSSKSSMKSIGVTINNSTDTRPVAAEMSDDKDVGEIANDADSVIKGDDDEESKITPVKNNSICDVVGKKDTKTQNSVDFNGDQTNMVNLTKKYTKDDSGVITATDMIVTSENVLPGGIFDDSNIKRFQNEDLVKEQEKTLELSKHLKKEEESNQNLHQQLIEKEKELNDFKSKFLLCQETYTSQMSKLSEELENTKKVFENKEALFGERIQETVHELECQLAKRYETKFKNQIIEYKSKLEEEKKGYVTSCQRAITGYNNIESFVKNLKLFEYDIGPIIVKCFSEKETDLSLRFSQKYEVGGFYTADVDDQLHKFEKEIDDYKEKIVDLQKKYDQRLNSEEIKNSELEKLEGLNKKYKDSIEERNGKLSELQTDLSRNEKKLEELRAQNFNLLNDKQSLIDDLKKLKDTQADIISNTFLELRKQLNESTENVKTLNGKYVDKINELNIANDMLGKERKEKMEKIEYSNLQASQIEFLEEKINIIVGDLREALTFNIVRSTRPDVTKELYNLLMVDKIDDLNLTQLQNIIKNMILLFEIPFDQFMGKVPFLVISLKYEKALLAFFANRVFYHLYNQRIDFKELSKEAYLQFMKSKSMNNINHPLQPILEELYRVVVTKI